MDWPTPESAWQKTLHAVGEKISFGGEDGRVGKAYLKKQRIVISAHQAVVIQANGRHGPDGDAYDAVLEPNSDNGVPSGVLVPPCFVMVKDG